MFWMELVRDTAILLLFNNCFGALPGTSTVWLINYKNPFWTVECWSILRWQYILGGNHTGLQHQRQGQRLMLVNGPRPIPKRHNASQWWHYCCRCYSFWRFVCLPPNNSGHYSRSFEAIVLGFNSFYCLIIIHTFFLVRLSILQCNLLQCFAICSKINQFRLLFSFISLSGRQPCCLF